VQAQQKGKLQQSCSQPKATLDRKENAQIRQTFNALYAVAPSKLAGTQKPGEFIIMYDEHVEDPQALARV